MVLYISPVINPPGTTVEKAIPSKYAEIADLEDRFDFKFKRSPHLIAQKMLAKVLSARAIKKCSNLMVFKISNVCSISIKKNRLRISNIDNEKRIFFPKKFLLFIFDLVLFASTRLMINSY